MPASSRPLVLVTVGSDHHPFDRLMRWTERWVQAGGRDRARVFAQCGTARPPREAEWRDALGHGDLLGLMEGSAAVVCHAGPGTIMECRRLGMTPIVVPRRAAGRESVDDHQVSFARRLAREGGIELAETEDRFRVLLDRAMARSDARPSPPPAEEGDQAIRRFQALVEGLLARSGSSSERSGDTSDPLRVLLISGWGRSGSTLLERMLGRLPGFLSVGEIRDLWLRGCQENRLCGCGQPFRECSFWAEVGSRAFGGWPSDPGRLLRLRNAVDRLLAAPFLVWPRFAPDFERKLRAYVVAMTRLYEGIQAVSGAQVIVDSSKIPTHALVLRRIPNVDLGIVHLVRDSRGVTFSWQRRVKRGDGNGRDDYLRTYGVAPAALRYLLYNGMTESLRLLGLPYVRLRYEDLVAGPHSQLSRILRRFDPDRAGEVVSLLGDGWVDLGADHTVDGNPMRFHQGRVPLRVDEEWRVRMPPGQRQLVSAITAPLLARYGYPVTA